MIEYVRQKYGERRVSQIITFGKLGAKSVVRDVGRVIGLELRRRGSDREDDPERAEHHARGRRGKNAGAEAARSRPSRPPASSGNMRGLLEGLSRNAGVHAAGVVIGDRDLSEYVPLCRDTKGNDVISQYAMGPLTDLGMLKMDFLGLKTLTVIEDTRDADSPARAGFFASTIPLDDAASFRSLQSRRNHRPLPDGIRRHDQLCEAVRRAEASTTSSR